MRVALAFWGLTRSLRLTYPTIRQRILDVLKKNNIEYTIFLHTYVLNTPYSNPRNKEYNLSLDNTEYQLLEAQYCQREDQNAVKQTLNLPAYRTHPDPWNTNYNMVDNFVLAMYSKKQVAQLIQTSGETFDYVLFLRPDVQFLNDFNPTWFQQTTLTQICVPEFHCFSFQFNDRFAIATQNNAYSMAQTFERMLDYSKQKPLHSESFHYDMTTSVLGLTIAYIPFYFNRVRANGQISNDNPLWEMKAPSVEQNA